MRLHLRAIDAWLVSVLSLGALNFGCQRAAPPLAENTNLTGQLILKPVGDVSILADPKQVFSLKAIATRVGVGPAPHLPIVVDFVGTPQGDLPLKATATDDQGFAVVPYTAPNVPEARMQIRLRAEGAPSLTFTIQIGRPIIAVDFQGPKPDYVLPNTDHTISVSVTNERGAPQPALLTKIELLGSNRSGAAFTGATDTLTDAAGVARFVFYSGADLQSYRARVTVADSSQTALAQNDLAIEVVASLPARNRCDFSSECAASDVCINGACVQGSRRCSATLMCPANYDCVANICVARPLCSKSGCPEGVAADVTGRWQSQYFFDLSQSLGVLGDLGKPIATIDAFFQGKLPFDIPIIGPTIESLLRELIRQYVPDWAPRLASSLDDFFTAFKQMTVAGTLEIRSRPDPLPPGSPTLPAGSLLSAEETWNRVEIRLPSLCPRRQADPNYPACSTVDIQLGRTLGNDITASAKAEPFYGSISGSTVTFAGRKAQLEVNRLLHNVVDLVVNVATNGRAKSFSQALPLLLNCGTLNSAANQTVCGIVNQPGCQLSGFSSACQAAAVAIGAGVNGLLDSVPLTWNLVDFQQVGKVEADSPKSSSSGATSGTVTVAARLSSGTLSGKSTLVTDQPLQGTFSATR